VIHLFLGPPNEIFRQVYPPKSCEHFFSPHACHMLCRAHLSWFSQPNNIWRRLQIMNLFVKQFRPAFCYFLRLRTKYLSLYLFSTHSAYVLPKLFDTKFHAHVKQQSKSQLCTFRSLCFQSVHVRIQNSEAPGSSITLRLYSARNFSVNEICQCRPHIYLTLPHFPRIY
jgi:hypothetical protein